MTAPWGHPANRAMIDRDPDLAALVGKLDRIRNQIQDHLTDRPMIGFDQRQSGIGDQFQINLFFFGPAPNHAHGSIDGIDNIDRV